MRKTVIAMAAILTIAFAGSAYARMGGGMGYAQCVQAGGQYQGMNYQGGQFKGRKMMAQANVQRGPKAVTQYTEAEAGKIINDYAAANLKGYQVGKPGRLHNPQRLHSVVRLRLLIKAATK
ncbi:MAG: hypothetical protein LRY51_12575 [Geovibrio sp.]|nr:hypothetical protein [Geovibrio sp.]